MFHDRFAIPLIYRSNCDLVLLTSVSVDRVLVDTLAKSSFNRLMAASWACLVLAHVDINDSSTSTFFLRYSSTASNFCCLAFEYDMLNSGTVVCRLSMYCVIMESTLTRTRSHNNLLSLRLLPIDESCLYSYSNHSIPSSNGCSPRSLISFPSTFCTRRSDRYKARKSFGTVRWEFAVMGVTLRDTNTGLRYLIRDTFRG